MVCDWLKSLHHFFIQPEVNQKSVPRTVCLLLCAGYLVQVLIGSLYCLHSLRLAGFITVHSFFPQSVKWMNILAMNLYLAPSLAVVYDESDDGNDDKQELIAHCCSLT